MMLLNNWQTVFIVEDDESICEVVTHLLKSVGLSTKSFKNPYEFLQAFDVSFKGCLLLDVRLPDMNGLDLYEELKKRHSTAPVIFMTGYPDIPLAVSAIKSGAVDFIVKPFNNQTLLEKIQKAIAIGRQNTQGNEQYFAIQTRFKSLTTREREILQLIVEGKLNKIIAHELGISIKTVELHRAHVMQKMQAHTVAELVKFYLLIDKTTLEIAVNKRFYE